MAKGERLQDSMKILIPPLIALRSSQMIGVFDSGFGGLTILREFLKALPGYDYLYLGDSARAPYGIRSPQVIYEWTRDSAAYLFNQGCDLVIVACFSASANALRRLPCFFNI